MNAFLAVWLTSQAAVCAGENDERLARIVNDWQERQRAVTSFRYVTKGKAMIAKGRYNAEKKPGVTEDIPKHDLQFDKNVTWMIDFKNNWIRKDKDTQTFDFRHLTLRPFFGATLYDGKRMVRFTPREKSQSPLFTPSDHHPDIEIQTDVFNQYFVLAPDYPVFLAHGRVPTVTTSPSPKSLAIPVDKHDFAVHRSAIIDGRACTVLKSRAPTDAIDEYWVDEARSSIILRWARYQGQTAGSNMWCQIDNSYEETDLGWLPKSWTVTHYWPERNVVSTWERLNVVSRDVNPVFLITDFQVTASPGQVVKDLPQKRLLRADDEGVRREFSDRSDVGGFGYWAIAGVVAVVTILGFCWKCLWSRKKPSGDGPRNSIVVGGPE